jgi:hypothetical protein
MNKHKHHIGRTNEEIPDRNRANPAHHKASENNQLDIDKLTAQIAENFDAIFLLIVTTFTVM